jgi:DNA invertase Pin-like site-specific DNA recombinase
MNIVLLKNRSDALNTTFQQKQILKYAHHHTLKIDTTEIENSSLNALLEDRKEFKGFLRSLETKDHLLIFDLSTLSSDIEELVKVFECLLTRSITIHIADQNCVIDTDVKPLVLLELLSKQREMNQHHEKEKIQGRPKGRMSKSKFDIYRPKVIELLEHRTSVSEIAKLLGVSRTSLKDYINSRGLKDLVKAKVALLKTTKKQPLALKKVAKECSLIAQHPTEGTHHGM